MLGVLLTLWCVLPPASGAEPLRPSHDRDPVRRREARDRRHGRERRVAGCSLRRKFSRGVVFWTPQASWGRWAVRQDLVWHGCGKPY